MIVWVSLLSISNLFAQQSVTGKVTDAQGAIPGVTVAVKGTTRGTQTGPDGTYSIQAAKGEIIRFSIVGYVAQEILAGDAKTINVSLQQDAGTLDEVVVTGMGVKREKRSLGYAFQDIKSETLVDARENNLANALTGKVSGLQVIKGSNGPASSSKIVLRGFNSLSGDNQPLIVVDGVPMENFAGAKNNDFWNPTADMGNGLGDLNPEDIESMSVLKGGAASAVYGSRAGNGVILITTKSGKSKEGAGINYSATIGLENLFIKPELQNSFSQGTGGKFAPLESSSWGEKISGQTVSDWDEKQIQLRPYDNIGNLFKTGVNTTHNLSFQKRVGENTNIYASGTYLGDNSKTPGVKLDRINLMSKVSTKFGENNKWSTDLKVQYMNTGAKNRAIGGANAGNYYSTALLFPTTLDITQFKPGMDVLGAEQSWYVTGTSAVNPYWAMSNKLSSDVRDRFMLNANIKYDFNDWLSANFQAGSDIYSTKFESKTYTGSRTLNNSYSTGQDRFFENNYIISLNAKKDNLIGKWGASGSLYGQLMKQNFNSINANASELVAPNLFSINNSKDNPGITESIRKKQINSIFGTAEINYDGFWFINFTARNDWSSTLSDANRSYFYPSVSTSLVVSDLVSKTGGTMPSWINFAKVRASYAETGNALDSYQLYNTYSVGRDPNGNLTGSKGKIRFNPNLRSELLKTIEVGFDTRFLNIFNLDFSYYKTNSTNQLLDIPMNPMSGYEKFKANAGNIQNQGFEIVFGASILSNPEKLQWNMNVNASRNINKIIELTDEINQYPLPGGVFDNISIFAEKGYEYGAIYGTKFVRVEDKNSPHYGKMILNGSGVPQSTEGTSYLGSQATKALIGVTNSFAYKNIGLSFLIDGKFGGKFFSGTNAMLQRTGLAAETAPNGERNNFVVDGVIADGNGGYVANTKEIDPQTYWNGVAGVNNIGIVEQNIYDATNIRLRNVQVSYNFPKSILKSSVIKSAKASLSANNVWMISSKANGVDPESVFAISTNAIGFEYLAFPTSRSYFLNLSFGF